MNTAKSSRQVAREHLQLGAKKQRQRHGMEAAALGYWHLHGFKGMIHHWFQGDDSSLVSPFRPKSFAAVQSTGRFLETSIVLEAINK